jgi:carbohydrate-binding DOMON domain-containing protein
VTSSSNFPASAFDSEAGLNCSILTSIFISTIPRYAKTIIATSITAITIMTNAVEVNRIWALPIPHCGERFLRICIEGAR